MRLATYEEIGIGSSISPSAEFIGVERLVLGDHVHIGPNVRVVGGSLELGDYSKVHNNVYIYPKKSVVLGQLAWIGQGPHLDGTGGIEAGDFLGVGINSALYSHIRHGDVTEGNKFASEKKLSIGDDVWFVGMCLVSAINAEDKSMALLGSVVTRPMRKNRIYGGNPALDLTDKLGHPWSEKSLDQKISNVRKFHDEFFSMVENRNLDREAIQICDTLPSNPDSQRTYYCLASRTFTKRNSVEEVAFNKWLFGFRAKFRSDSKK